ncbi:MAG: hypothetical protein ACT4OY_00100 [Alphaproteobacteria bacterium]
MEHDHIIVYVKLLEEETPVARATEAVDLGNGLYKLLPTPDYDPGDEVWEFLPGSIVRCETTNEYRDKNILLAVERAK